MQTDTDRYINIQAQLHFSVLMLRDTETSESVARVEEIRTNHNNTTRYYMSFYRTRFMGIISSLTASVK